VAAKLEGVQQLSSPISVRLADGGTLNCSANIPSVEWSTNGYSFHSALKILPMGSFELILGMDWLADFSPMKVHWQQKWMTITYGSSSVTLQGILPDSSECPQLFHIASEAQEQQQPIILPDIQCLLNKFPHLFAEPIDLPRECDHSIPLVPGAQPFSVRSYRYLPAWKSEIEK
jgi:hypothetical protein